MEKSIDILKGIVKKIEDLEGSINSLNFKTEMYLAVLKQIVLMYNNHFQLIQPKILIEKKKLDTVDLEISYGKLQLVNKKTRNKLSQEEIDDLKRCLNMNQLLQEDRS